MKSCGLGGDQVLINKLLMVVGVARKQVTARTMTQSGFVMLVASETLESSRPNAIVITAWSPKMANCNKDEDRVFSCIVII